MSGDSDDGNGASPYDEPTGAIPVPERLGPDRDGFHDRYARPGLRRVDALDDLDPGEVQTVTPSVRGRRQDPSAGRGQAPAGPPPEPVPGRSSDDARRAAPAQTGPPPPAVADPDVPEVTPAESVTPKAEPDSAPTDVIERPAPRAVPQRVGAVKKSRWAAFRPGGSDKSRASSPGSESSPGSDRPDPAVESDDPAALGAVDTDPAESGPDAVTVQLPRPRNPAPVDEGVEPATPHPTEELLPEPAMAYSALDPVPGHEALAEAPMPEPRRTSDPVAAGDMAPAAPVAGGRGTIDVGLLVLRVAVGSAALAHGLQKLFGWWNGPGLDGFEAFLANAPDSSIGFDGSAAGWLAILGAVSETSGGALLILGLLTPIAASAVLGVMLVAATFKVTLAGGLWYITGAGVGIEYEVTLICAALAILLIGPGRIALDVGRGWATRPKWGSLALAVLGIAAAVAVWVAYNGTNPFDSPGNRAR